MVRDGYANIRSQQLISVEPQIIFLHLRQESQTGRAIPLIGDGNRSAGKCKHII